MKSDPAIKPPTSNGTFCLYAEAAHVSRNGQGAYLQCEMTTLEEAKDELAAVQERLRAGHKLSVENLDGKMVEWGSTDLSWLSIFEAVDGHLVRRASERAGRVAAAA